MAYTLIGVCSSLTNSTGSVFDLISLPTVYGGIDLLSGKHGQRILRKLMFPVCLHDL